MSAERIAVLKQFIEQKPDDPFPRYALAMELKGAADLEGAAAALKDLVARVPGYVPSYLQFGTILDQLGRIEEARSVLTVGIEQARKSGNSHALSEMEGVLNGL